MFRIRPRFTIRATMVGTAAMGVALGGPIEFWRHNERVRLLNLAAERSISGKDYLLTAVTLERDALKEPDAKKLGQLQVEATKSRKKSCSMFTQASRYLHGASLPWPTQPEFE